MFEILTQRVAPAQQGQQGQDEENYPMANNTDDNSLRHCKQ